MNTNNIIDTSSYKIKIASYILLVYDHFILNVHDVNMNVMYYLPIVYFGFAPYRPKEMTLFSVDWGNL